MKSRLIFILFCLLVLSGKVIASSPTYDGQWWLALDEEEQFGFLDGYTNCAVYMANLDVQFDESVLTYVPRLKTYLHEHPESVKESVETLLWKIATPPYSHPVKHSKGDEERAEKWNDKDGKYWLPHDGRLGYIQGFLECYSKRTNQPYGTFSKPAEFYVAAISKWYGIDPKNPDQIDAHKRKTKIPDVLFRFHDPIATTTK